MSADVRERPWTSAQVSLSAVDTSPPGADGVGHGKPHPSHLLARTAALTTDYGPVSRSAGPPGPDRLLEADDVAFLLGVPRTFVYALARRGALPTVRIGERYVRFRARAIEDWIAAQESTRPRGTR